MIRSSILSDKNDEQSKCVQLHESLLTELFRVTVGLSRSQEHNPNDTSPSNDTDGEVSFLETNKLSKGRFFDPSTLPTVHFNDIPNATGHISLSGLTETPAITQEATAGIPHGKDGVSTGTNRGGNEVGWTVISLEETRDFAATLPAIKSPLPLVNEIVASHPDVQQPVLGEGQTVGLWTETKSLEVNESQRTIRTNSYSTAPTAGTSLLDSPKDKPQQKPSEAEADVIVSGPLQLSSEAISPMLTSTAGFSPSERSRSNVHQPTPPSKDTFGSGSEVLERRRATDGRQPLPEVSGTLADVEEVEVGRIRDNAVEVQGPLQKAVNVSQSGFPSTPDEQLRLEEAQSLQLSKAPLTIEKALGNDQTGSHTIQPSASISSQFDHDEGEETTVSTVPTSYGENSFRPAAPSNEHFSEHNRRVERPSLGLRNQTLPGMTGNLSKDLTFSRRPPMRIDTGVPPAADQLKSLPSKRTPGTANTYTSSSAATPCKSGPATSQAQSPPERMTTRVSSGALRHKSVSEILGETPKSVTHHGEKGSLERAMNDIQREEYAVQTPRSASSTATSDSAAFKVRLNELREKERSKLSTVFARQQPSNLSRYSDSAPAKRSDVIDPALRNKDYLLPLFAAQAATPPHSQPLHSLIASAHKTLTTANHYTDFHEQQDCRMLNKIYQLQYSNRWSLRQLERSVEPDRPATHWDVLLSHVKWMRTDYREERKWKVTAAKSLADLCASWVASSPEQRRSMEVKVRTAFSTTESRPSSALTPELIPSMEDDSSDAAEDDNPCGNVAQGSAPAAIFSLPPDMFVFGLEKTPATGKLLQELPLYQPSLEIQDAVLGLNIFLPESVWKKPLVPISKFAEGQMVTYEQGPARKRSRYNYQGNDHSDHDHNDGIYSTHVLASITLEPEQEDVALFDPENKHIRDRIHAGHAFRPPSEHIMPSQGFFESRQSSQWTQGEDDELRRLVREYAYNWSLISSCLSSPSIFSSGAERRTPWECFERWVGLEGLPAEMSKTQYFRAYHSRLQAAQRTHEAQQQAIQQHQGHNTPHMPMRRRTTQPFLVDRRKNVKHLHLVDAMRKLAKKRETAVQKQQHVANLAAMRKANEAVQPRPAMHTPQEFSRLKYERECKMQETAKAYRQQILQHQKAALAQKANPQPGPPGGPNMMQPGRNPTSVAANGTSPLSNPPLPNGQLPGGSVNQPRPPPIPRLVNGGTSNGVLPSNPQGIPHAPMQPHMQMQPRMPPQMGSDNMRVYQEATRVQQEQQRYLQQQRQQHHPQATQVGSSGSPNMGNPSLMAPSNSTVLTSLQGGRSGSPNGVSPPPSGSSSSPRMTNSSTQPQPLSSGMVPAVNQISNHMKARHPQASPEQITKMTTEHLNQYRMSHVHAAMQAAAGASNASAAAANANIALPGASSAPSSQQQQALINGSSPMLKTQQYAQMMRSQQSNQQNRNGVGSGVMGANTGSRSATPQNHKSGSAQGGRPSQSPRPSQAQMAGGQ